MITVGTIQSSIYCWLLIFSFVGILDTLERPNIPPFQRVARDIPAISSAVMNNITYKAVAAQI